MGINTRNFRQSAKSLSGSAGARNYSQIQRSGSWHKKIFNFIKIRGKGGIT